LTVLITFLDLFKFSDLIIYKFIDLHDFIIYQFTNLLDLITY